MANKRRHETPSSSNTPLIFLAAAGVLVAALVIWALTRTVERHATVVSEPPADTQPLPATTPPPDTAPPAAATATPAFSDEDERSVPRIAAEDLRAKNNRGEVLVIDVRDPRAYATAHIPGSINIAFASVDGAAPSIPKNRPIVTYCT